MIFLEEGKEYEVNLYFLIQKMTPVGIVVSNKEKITEKFQASSPEVIFNYLKQGHDSWEKKVEDRKIIYYNEDNLFKGKHKMLFRIEILN